ncbi:hypothetical protein P3X46_004436 [Hevea brasiliensis]|uniref:RNase H type-1 domain-containing protein n=1 Tax=Hevea brasiliensis TaxID=3981 RepID=A0ABQ9MYL4_HEVBR|nr:hypothetical protein P3X46_004436 [Hevea brasiliensis]
MDAIIFSNDAKSSDGASIRDSNGHFVLSVTSFFEVVHCPHMAKAMGLREVLLWLGSCNWKSVDIEMDSKMFADAINSLEYDFSKFGQIIHNCQHLLSQGSNWILVWIRRQANIASHSFARLAILYASLTLCSELWSVMMFF